MLLQRKIDRAMKWSRERRMRADGLDPEEEEIKAELRKHSGQKDPLPSMEELIAEEKESEQLEKSDLPSMILAGLITILPACLILVVLVCLVAYFFMIR